MKELSELIKNSILSDQKEEVIMKTIIKSLIRPVEQCMTNTLIQLKLIEPHQSLRFIILNEPNHDWRKACSGKEFIWITEMVKKVILHNEANYSEEQVEFILQILGHYDKNATFWVKSENEKLFDFVHKQGHSYFLSLGINLILKLDTRPDNGSALVAYYKLE